MRSSPWSGLGTYLFDDVMDFCGPKQLCGCQVNDQSHAYERDECCPLRDQSARRRKPGSEELDQSKHHAGHDRACRANAGKAAAEGLVELEAVAALKCGNEQPEIDPAREHGSDGDSSGSDSHE